MSATHRRPVLYLLTTVLAGATAFALFGTAMTLGAARVADPRPVATETVVRAFYFAINEAIRTGDTAPLDGVVAEELTAHGGTESLAPGRSGLARYLMALHATSPDVEIHVAQVAAAGDRAIAYLEVRGGAEDTTAGLPRRASQDAWGSIDGLRVVGHRVVELWSGASGLSLVEPLGQITHQAPIAGRQVVVLDRLILPPDGRYDLPGVKDNRLVYVDDGFVDVETAGSLPNSAPASTVTVARSLAPGDFVTLPAGNKTGFHNGGDAPATLLVATVATPGEQGRLTFSPDTARHEFRSLADDVPQDIGQDRTFTDGILLQPLAGGVVATIPPDANAAAIGRVTLLPGATLPPFAAPGPFLLAVETGALGVQSTGGKVWVNHGVRGWNTNLDVGTLDAGDGAFLHAETAITLRNDGSEPVVLLVVILLPDDPLLN
ncbi:MAG: ester cyclase [Thermomicrobiales bacterium]